MTISLSSKHLLPILGVSNDTTWLQTLYLQNQDTYDSNDIHLSILIPYYKRPITLEQTLNSILRANYDLSKLEILILDDGSPKKDQPNLSQYLEKGLDIKHLWQNDDGYRLSAVRNLGLRTAKYDNLVILDCDLAVHPFFLKAHARILKLSTNVISIGLRDSYTIDNSVNPSLFLEKDPGEIGIFQNSDWRLARLEKNPMLEYKDDCWVLCSGGNLAFNRNVISKCGLFSEEFNFWGGEDLEWAYRAFKKGIYFFINRDAKAYHYESRSSEFQIDRKLNLERKEDLLKELVPVFHNMEYTSGRIPYVSVFITCFNKAPFILEAIESISSSTKYRHEIVIVDDGSTDHIEDVVLKIEKKNPLQDIRFFKRKHLGVEKTYQDCLNLCRGEYIAQLDADDILMPNAIDALILKIKGKPIDLVYGKYSRFIDPTMGSKDLPTHTWTYPICDRFVSLFKGMHTHPLRVFKARALHRLGELRSLNINGAVDFSLYSQLLMVSYGVFVNQDSYLYRQTKTSISNEKSDMQALCTKMVVEHNLNEMIQFGEFKINVKTPKQFDVEVSNSDVRFVYIKHLGIHDSYTLDTLYKSLKSHPSIFIHENFKKLDSLQLLLDVELQELHTKKKFEIQMTLDDFQKLEKDLKSHSVSLEFKSAILKA